MEHGNDQRHDGGPPRPETVGEPVQPYRPFDPDRLRTHANGDRSESDQDRSQPIADANDPEQDRRQAERRHAERRATLTMGGRRNQEDRRRHERRMRLAGAGLLATIAFAIGGHQVLSKTPTLGILATSQSEPSASVDVDTDFHLPVWDRASLEPIIQEAAALHGLSPSLIRAVIQTESRFNPLAVSRVGAQGLMQLMPNTARHVGIENPFDPRENVLGGTKYLSSLLERFKGNTARAVAAYNAGPTVVARHRGLPPFRETQGYVRKIHKLVQGTDAEFSLPAPAKVRKASLRSRSGSRKATISRKATRSRSIVRKATVVGKASAGGAALSKARVRTARKPSRRG